MPGLMFLVQLLICFWLMQNKQKYRSATEVCHASFSPIVVLVDSALRKEAALFLGHIADRLIAA